MLTQLDQAGELAHLVAAELPSFSPENLITSMGSWAVVGIVLIIFAECGLLIGFFLPGDTLLFIAGLFAATAATAPATGLHLNLALLITLLAAASFAGNMVGYWIGRRLGPAVFRRPDARFLKPHHIARSERFFNRYGTITIVLARFVPIVRTVATAMAGASRMDLKTYTIYSALGGALWVSIITIAGYHLGQIPFIADNLDYIVIGAAAVVALAGAVPALLHILARRRNRTATTD